MFLNKFLEVVKPKCLVCFVIGVFTPHFIGNDLANELRNEFNGLTIPDSPIQTIHFNAVAM